MLQEKMFALTMFSKPLTAILQEKIFALTVFQIQKNVLKDFSTFFVF